MSETTKDETVTPDNVHITDAPAKGTGTVTTDNVHITDAPVTTDNVHITSDPS